MQIIYPIWSNVMWWDAKEKLRQRGNRFKNLINMFDLNCICSGWTNGHMSGPDQFFGIRLAQELVPSNPIGSTRTLTYRIVCSSHSLSILNQIFSRRFTLGKCTKQNMKSFSSICPLFWTQVLSCLNNKIFSILIPYGDSFLPGLKELGKLPFVNAYHVHLTDSD